MSQRAARIRAYLGHMHDAVSRIQLYMQGKTREHFLSDPLLQDAIVRNFEVLGEAAHNVLEAEPDASTQFPRIPFAAIYGMRNRLSHGYFAIDLDVVWKVIERDVPALRLVIESTIADLNN
ncbi:MAG TPA: DUF86 domain-containing protein [Terracidiphilus sp.]|nr:DUF86 domain-containing protein [Terracidiphilus sp.]